MDKADVFAALFVVFLMLSPLSAIGLIIMFQHILPEWACWSFIGLAAFFGTSVEMIEERRIQAFRDAH